MEAETHLFKKLFCTMMKRRHKYIFKRNHCPTNLFPNTYLEALLLNILRPVFKTTAYTVNTGILVVFSAFASRVW